MKLLYVETGHAPSLRIKQRKSTEYARKFQWPGKIF